MAVRKLRWGYAGLAGDTKPAYAEEGAFFVELDSSPPAIFVMKSGTWTTSAGAAGANTALSNLAAVAINTALLDDAAAADDFGSATLPWKDIWLAGASGTPGTNNFRLTGTATAARVITLPDATGTLLYSGGALGTPASGVLTNVTGLPTVGLVDGAVTLAKMANIATARFIGRTTAGTGVPEALTTAQSIEELLKEPDWRTISLNAGWATTIVTSGAVSQSPFQLTVLAGATGGGSAIAKTPLTGALQGGDMDIVPFSKRIVWIIRFATRGNTTNGITRVTLGKTNADGLGALGRAGLGFQIENLTLKLLAYGASLQTVTPGTTTTLTSERVYHLAIVSDGAGNVEWFINKTSEGTTASGPSSDGAGEANYMQTESLNGGDAASQRIDIFDMKILVLP